ncbi:MAG TPA: acyl-CoA dehydrogenase family protein [Parvibaculum sp.]
MSDMSMPTKKSAAEWSAWADEQSLRLAERAQAAEEMRSVPPETISDARAAGFFAMLTPETLGGQAASFGIFLYVVRRLSRGCVSSGWTLSFLALHAWLLAKFDKPLQDTLFRDGATPLMPAPLAPTGEAAKVDGGYLVNGRWEWATGVNHADWVMVSCIEPEGMGPRFCIVRIEDVEVLDVWRTAGMAATGSNTVIIRDLFVPEHMTLAAWQLKLAASPGEALHPRSTVVYPMSATLALVAATPALGALEAAVDIFRNRMKSKMQAYGDVRQGDLPVTHLRLGEAIAAHQAAGALWDDAIKRLERDGPLGHQTPLETLVAIRVASASIVRLANDAIDRLAGAAGASAGFLSFPLQRQLRDVQMMRGHVVFDWDRAAQIAGKVALGREPAFSDLL